MLKAIIAWGCRLTTESLSLTEENTMIIQGKMLVVVALFAFSAFPADALQTAPDEPADMKNLFNGKDLTPNRSIAADGRAHEGPRL